MGQVYSARDTRLDRTVAIKVLSPELTGDSSARRRFEREARAAAALAHPHICTLLDIGRQDEIDYLVMEYLEGETLATRLGRGKFSVDQALACSIQIAEALAAAHRAGIVHRDLKPANIMLTKGGAKLLDFGLAKPQRPPVAGDATDLRVDSLTHTGTILGTVQSWRRSSWRERKPTREPISSRARC
jgi:eukaryotic-like serine/threonine-protein kinase